MMNFLKLFDRSQGGSFVNHFRVFDPRINNYTYLTMYVGDRSGIPYMVNPQTLRPSFLEGRNRQFDSGVKAVGV